MRSRSNRLISYVTIFILIFVILTAACNQKEPESTAPANEWRIPYLIFLSGPIAGDASMHKWLTNQVAAEINSAGGIAGKPLVIDFYDTALDPPKAAACMAQIIDARALNLAS